MGNKTIHDPIEEVYTKITSDGLVPVAGTYFNGKAYLFYSNGNLVDVVCMQLETQTETKVENHKEVTKEKEVVSVVKLKNKKKIMPRNIEYITEVKYGGSIQGGSVPALATCVHDGEMYLFYTDQDGHVFAMRTEDGENWKHDILLDFQLRKGCRFAVLSVESRLYLIGSNTKSKLEIFWSNDSGESWESSMNERFASKFYNNPIFDNVTHVAACGFRNREGKSSIMVTFIQRTSHGEKFRCMVLDYTENGLFYGDNGLNYFEVIEALEGVRVSHFALANGSIQNGSKGKVIQLFISGIDRRLRDRTPARRLEYNIDTKQWDIEHMKIRNWGHMSTPGEQHVDAFQYFKTDKNTKEITSEIWFTQSFAGKHNNNIGIGRYSSDKLRLVEEITGWADDQHRVLIGVVESPPPYILNGSQVSELFLERTSKFTFKWAEEDSSAISATYNMGALVSVSGNAPLTSIGGEIKIAAETARTYATQKVSVKDFSIEIMASENKKTATNLYMKPNFTRYRYSVQDYSGADTDTEIIVYSVSELTIEAVVGEDIRNFPGANGHGPDPQNILTYYKRFNEFPDYVDKQKSINMPVAWIESIRIEDSFSKINKTINSSSNTISIESGVSIDIEKIFSIDGETTFSYTYDVEVSTEFSTQMGCMVYYPNPRSDHPEDYTQIKLRLFVFYPNENDTSACYWIPDGLEQFPWCVAWSLDNYETMEQNADKNSLQV